MRRISAEINGEDEEERRRKRRRRDDRIAGGREGCTVQWESGEMKAQTRRSDVCVCVCVCSYLTSLSL